MDSPPAVGFKAYLHNVRDLEISFKTFVELLTVELSHEIHNTETYMSIPYRNFASRIPRFSIVRCSLSEIEMKPI